MTLRSFATTFFLLMSGGAALAVSPPPMLGLEEQKALNKEIDLWLDREIVTLSIETQNEKFRDITQAKILELDQEWRAETNSKRKPLISSTMLNPLSVYLTRMQGQSYGLFVEIFVMDSHGLNVGVSSATSDYWQGDEAKFQKTFGKGQGAYFMDEPEWDEERAIWRVQLNKSLTNSRTNELIGAVTVEVNLTEFQRLQAARR